MLRKIWHKIRGEAKDPFSKDTWGKVALIAFFAWVGLGSDGLSSANYGPEEAFKALAHYPMLGIYLALAIAVTVFVIAAAYNQVIELFPTGGGGYKVANTLLHPIAGLVSGSALIVDYILTIAISVAAASDAIFSLLPPQYLYLNLPLKLLLVILLLVLNLRGMKESIKVLLPIFLGFVITHLVLIVYGIMAHGSRIPEIAHQVGSETHHVIATFGLAYFLTLLLKAYSLGGGTYTGLEAVSNNVNVLAEPRVRTGKWTMFYMALSLSVTAGGIILLYMLWNVHPNHGQTYNAIVFSSIMAHLPFHHGMLIIVLAFEAGILLLGANTGFLGGPAVLGNMALDKWVPTKFANLSDRLVKQNGVLFFGIGAIAILLLTDGHVGYLVILYSVNVFLTFSITLFGLCKHWITSRRDEEGKKSKWLGAFILSLVGFIICATILIIILVEKFTAGAWLTVIVTTGIIYACYRIHKHYKKMEKTLRSYTRKFRELIKPKSKTPEINPKKPTAIIFVDDNACVGMHTLMTINRLFPGRFHNYVFVQVGIVDIQTIAGRRQLNNMKKRVERNLQTFVNFAHTFGFGADTYAEYDTNPIDRLTELAEELNGKYHSPVFFCGRIVYQNDNMLTRWMRSDIPVLLQQRLHYADRQMIILPMKVT